MFIFGRSRRPIGMCFRTDDGAGDGSDTTGGGGGGGGRSDMTGAGAGANAGSGGGAGDSTEFSLPDAFKDKEYAKDAKSWDDVINKVDGYKNLAGKRAVPEYGKASDQDWEDFFSRTRPEGGKYTLNEDGIFENLRGNAEFSKGLEGVFNKAGLTQKQVDILMDPKDGYSGFMMAEIAKINGRNKAAEEAADTDFETRLKSLTGDRRDEALANALKVKDELGIAGELSDLDPSQLASVTYAFDKFYREFIADDAMNKKSNTGGGNSNDPDSIQASLNKYKQDNWEAYSNPNHAQYSAVMKNVQSMTDQLMKVSSLK